MDSNGEGDSGGRRAVGDLAGSKAVDHCCDIDGGRPEGAHIDGKRVRDPVSTSQPASIVYMVTCCSTSGMPSPSRSAPLTM